MHAYTETSFLWFFLNFNGQSFILTNTRLLSIEDGPPTNDFYSCDLDLDPMTLVFGIWTWPEDSEDVYPHNKNELSKSRLSKVKALQTRTDAIIYEAAMPGR